LIVAGTLCPDSRGSGALTPPCLAGSAERFDSQRSPEKPSPVGPETTAANSGKEIVLSPGKVIEQELSGGQTHIYQISLSAGQSAGLSVQQRGIDVVVQIFDPAANLLAEFDAESRKQGTETVAWVAESDGAYQIRVNAKYPKESSAQYAICLLEIRAATQTDRSLFAAHKLSTESQAQSDAGKYDEALDLAKNALAQGEAALGPDEAYVGDLLLRLGGAQFLKGDTASALLTLQRALRIDETTLGKEDPQTALVLQALGNLYSNSGDYPKGREVLQRALDITEKTLGPDSPRVAKCLVLSAILQQRRGDFPRALAELQRALAIDQETLAPDDLAVIKVMDSLGDLYFDMNDQDRAVAILQRTLKLEEQTLGPNHPWVAHPLQNLGIIARRREQYTLSLEYLWRAEKIREKALGSRHQATASLLVNIGNVYASQGDYPNAIQTFQRALSILQDTAGPYHEWTLMTLGNLARIYAAQGDTLDAVEYMRRTDEAAEQNLSLNLAIGSEHERLAYADKLAYLISRTISLSVSEAPHDRAAAELAAQVILQRKGRVLDAVAGSVTALRRRLQPDDQKLLDELSTTTADLAKSALRGPGQTPPEEYHAHLASLQRQRETLETEISRRSAGYYLRSDAVTLAAVRALIPSGSLLLEFAVFKPYYVRNADAKEFGDPRYVVYLIPAEGEVQWKDLGDAKEIDAAVEAFRQALRDPKRGDARQLARMLDEKLMGPVRSLQVDARHLIISPDGELNLVPFEALIDEQGHYLLQNYAINYVSSGRDLLRMQTEHAHASAPVIVADPSFGEPEANTQIASAERPKAVRGNAIAGRRSITSGKDLADVYFAPLAGSAQEARELKSLFPEAKVLIGQQATKAELEQVSAPSILHIATHGFFLEHEARSPGPSPAKPGANDASAIRGASEIENPLLRSGLALAGANLDKDGNEDGILTALEASNLNLWGTKLVTLSACDTGVGEVKNGEGVYGLRRAFVLAGAETLVMSLWPVSDYVTRELMTDYYSGLKKGLGRGEALRQAQLTMLRRKGRQHPFYWASFIQAGEWANLDGKR
jgi:CHAT domain-containing protein/tetratricopeptide (TPR) repeat protein